MKFLIVVDMQVDFITGALCRSRSYNDPHEKGVSK